MRRLRREAPGDELDLSPLIDVVFILLIFFMVTTTFVRDAQVELERPSAKSATRASTKAVRITIDRGERILMDEVPVRPWMVQSRVRDALAQEGGKGTVLVISDRRVRAQTLIEVIDQARLGGATEVGVVTDLEQG